ncbi:MAG TPA: ribosomal protein S18-alanine N-acetyltransferase [Anaeromyxobacteraceae bacterium]|nr:ribosomal protein S18-alanine N-acetyltransferase [Anaeromyxobacteraceae bacterium]
MTGAGQGAAVASPLRFRPMREADLPRIVEIERGGFRHPWSEELIRRELDHAWSRVLLAVEEAADGSERILGFVVFWVVHDEIHVLNVATALEARRRGVARALMGQTVEEGRRRGARVATLEVRRSNVPARSLYRALGYREVGVRPNYYADEGEDAIVMDLDL